VFCTAAGSDCIASGLLSSDALDAKAIEAIMRAAIAVLITIGVLKVIIK
jgi:hypothetical protein